MSPTLVSTIKTEILRTCGYTYIYVCRPVASNFKVVRPGSGCSLPRKAGMVCPRSGCGSVKVFNIFLACNLL